MGGSTSRISQLDAELSRLRRRAARQKQKLGTNSAAWQQWSNTLDEIAGIIDQLVAASAPDAAGLAVKIRAILWQFEINESLVDSPDLRRLKRFGRELMLLARKV